MAFLNSLSSNRQIITAVWETLKILFNPTLWMGQDWSGTRKSRVEYFERGAFLPNSSVKVSRKLRFLYVLARTWCRLQCTRFDSFNTIQQRINKYLHKQQEIFSHLKFLHRPWIHLNTGRSMNVYKYILLCPFLSKKLHESLSNGKRRKSCTLQEINIS